jgi:broad specificity phosphatase PhoE
MPLAEESSSQPMDTGSDESTLRECFGDLIDMRHLQEYPGWNNNSGDFKSDHKSLIARAHKLREFLRARPEKNIALVSHGSFAHFIVGNIDHEGAEVTRMWDNAECRSYTFLSEEDKECQMKETEESKNGRRDLEKKCAGYVLSVVGGRRGSAGDVISPGLE